MFNNTHSDQWTEGQENTLPSMNITTAAVVGGAGGEGLLLTPELWEFKAVGKKAMYTTCVKVSNECSLAKVKSMGQVVWSKRLLAVTVQATNQQTHS